MKGFLATVALIAALNLPAMAQYIPKSAFWSSQIREKGVNRTGSNASATARINFDRGLLLKDPNLGNFKIRRTLLEVKGVPRAAFETRFLRGANANLTQKGQFRQLMGIHNYPRPINNIRQERGALLSQRSAHFSSHRPYTRIEPHIPGTDSHVREALTYHFAWLGGASGLQVKDPVAKDNWSLRMACTPRLKKESPNRYTAQVACYGRLGQAAQQLPVVVQFTLLGNEKNWKIHGQPVVVSANRVVRPGHNVMADVWAEESAPAAVQPAIETGELPVSE